MNNQDNQSDSFADENEFGSPDGSGNVADSKLSLEDINTLLGRKYPDIETARKGLKSTYSMVGKVGQLEKDLETLKKSGESNSANTEKIKQIETELFYSNNPQYKPYKDTISAMGGNPAEVVEKEAFKKLFTDLSEFEKTKNAKSVLESNPRIGQAKTRIEEAKDLNIRGKYADANAAATNAVLEAYEKQ